MVKTCFVIQSINLCGDNSTAIINGSVEKDRPLALIVTVYLKQ